MARWKADCRVRQRYATHDELEPRIAGEESGENATTPKALQVATGAFAGLCLAVALTHVLMLFLEVAPANPVSQRFAKQTKAWISPWFEQNWKVFAPTPTHVNTQFFARTGSISAAGDKKVSGWLDISAVDQAGMRHSPYPSHEAQHLLPVAWKTYLTKRRTGEGSLIAEQYLRNIAVHRVAEYRPLPFQVIQLKVVARPIAPPDSARAPAGKPAIRILPWWDVPSDGH